jgi:ubiquitin-conjugating enzyme E2 R
MAGHSSVASRAIRSLQQEWKKIHEEPVEGFRVRLPDESNLFVWEVAIFGPPETLYEGGYFKVITCFCFAD